MISSTRNPVRAPRHRRHRHAQPAARAQRGDACHGARARRATCRTGRATPPSPAWSSRRRAGVRSPPAATCARSTISAAPAAIDEALAYWRDEYRLNALIKRYRKPYVALIDGVVMGGGVGVAIHGSHRVAGDRFRFAMPEVGIGFFPDVGATWFLPRLPGELGTYCALTGRAARSPPTRWRPASRRTGCPRRAFPICSRRFAARCPVDALLGAFAEPAGRGARCRPARPVIDRLLAGDRIEDILAGLDAAAADNDAGRRHSPARPPPRSAANRRPASRSRWRNCAAAAGSISTSACAPNSA